MSIDSQTLLECIVFAAPEPVARDFSTEYQSAFSDHVGVAVYIDHLLCALQDAGLIDPEYHTDSKYWKAAATNAFGEEED